MDGMSSILSKVPVDILIKCAERILLNNFRVPNVEYYERDGTMYFKIKDVVYKAYLDDNTKEELDQILEYLGEEVVEDGRKRKIDRIMTISNSMCKIKSKTPLRFYQTKVVDYIMNPKNHSLLVVHGTGTGKTLTALAASQCFLEKNPNGKVLVISPASLIKNFHKEMEEKYGGVISDRYTFYSFTKFGSINGKEDITPVEVYIEDNIREYRERYPDRDDDQLRKAITAYFHRIIKNGPEFSEYRNRAHEFNKHNNYDTTDTMVIVDEVHNIRNMKKAYISVYKSSLQAKKMLLLTATPFVNRLEDFRPIIHVMYKDKSILRKEHRTKGSNTDTGELLYLYRFLKDKVSYFGEKSSEFFPRVKVMSRVIFMTMDFYRRYERALLMYKDFGDSPETFYHGYRRAVNKVGVENYINQKMPIVRDIVRKGEQTLVFSNWLDAGVNILSKEFDNEGVSYLIITGSIDSRKRLDIVRAFNNKKVQVLIITLAGSEGLDLKETQNVIILDPVWNPSVLEQIMGRAIRYKSHVALPEEDRLVNVYQLLLKTPEDVQTPSGDEILYGIIKSKRRTLGESNKMLENASI